MISACVNMVGTINIGESVFINKSHLHKHITPKSTVEKLISDYSQEYASLMNSETFVSNELANIETELQTLLSDRNSLNNMLGGAFEAEKPYLKKKEQQLYGVLDSKKERKMRLKQDEYCIGKNADRFENLIESLRGSRSGPISDFFKLCEKYSFIDLNFVNSEILDVPEDNADYLKRHLSRYLGKTIMRKFMKLPKFVVQRLDSKSKKDIIYTLNLKPVDGMLFDDGEVEVSISRQNKCYFNNNILSEDVSKIVNDLYNIKSENSLENNIKNSFNNKNAATFMYYGLRIFFADFNIERDNEPYLKFIGRKALKNSILGSIYHLISPYKGRFPDLPEYLQAPVFGLMIGVTSAMLTLLCSGGLSNLMNGPFDYLRNKMGIIKNERIISLKYTPPDLPGFIPPGVKSKIEEATPYFGDEIYLLREIKPNEWTCTIEEKTILKPSYVDRCPVVIGISPFGTTHYIDEFNVTEYESEMVKKNTYKS